MNSRYRYIGLWPRLREATLNVEFQIYSKHKERKWKNKMNALTIIYWTRVLLGIVAALICTLLGEATGGINIFNAISIALLVYIVSYYVYKPLFLPKVEKTSKIFTTGVGAYFLTWIVMFGLFFTLMGPTLILTNPAPNTVFSAGETVTIVAKITNQFGNQFSGADVTTNIPNSTIVQLNETSPGIYSATYNITSSDPAGPWQIRVNASINGRYREATIIVHIQNST